MADNESTDVQETAQLIRSGRYFDTAVDWYAAVYISKISERAIFLIVLLLAIVISLLCVGAFSSLTPIVQPRGILLVNTDIDKWKMSISGLRSKDENMDAAMRKFFISTYVASRESHRGATLNASKAFITAHSDPLVMQAYANEISPQNPQNIAAKLGSGGERVVDITDLVVNEKSEPHVANVTFVTHDLLGGQVTSLQRQATLAFYYTPLTVKEVVDKDSGKVIIKTEEPQFQVVQYEHN